VPVGLYVEVNLGQDPGGQQPIDRSYKKLGYFNKSFYLYKIKNNSYCNLFQFIVYHYDF